MIWRSSFHSRIVQFADFLTIQLGFIIAYLIWDLFYLFGVNNIPKPFSIEIQYLFQISLLGIIYIILFSENLAYSYQRFTSLFREYLIVIKVSVMGLFLMVFSIFMFGDKTLPRTIFILSFFTILSLLLVQKTILFFIARKMRNNGFNRKRVLVIGTGTRAKQFVEIVKKNFGWGLDIIGLLTGDEEKIGKDVYGFGVIGGLNDIETILKEKNPEEVIFTISTKRFEKFREVFEVCEREGVRIRLNSDFFGRITKKVRVDSVYGLNIITFNSTKEDEFQLFIKRLIDILGSLLAILVFLPFMLIAIVGILITDGRPVIYIWNVIGKDKKPIKSWKFRTMIKNADELKEKLKIKNEMQGPVFKIQNDPRILQFGKWLRKWSIDETPQLFSVLKGDMSLVGPRPVFPEELKGYESWQRRKLSVKPGITCLWQISGRNHINKFDDWVKLDLEYIDNWSIWLDIKILIKTIPAILIGKGAS